MSNHRSNTNPDDTTDPVLAANTSATETDTRYFGTADQIVDRYTHCGFCGSNMHFTHVTDFSRNITHEQSKCIECGVKTQQVTHRLQ